MDQLYEQYLQEHELEADKYNPTERLVVLLSREMPDNSVAMVGTGLPTVAAGLAQRTCAPNLTIILETGSVGPSIAAAPISVADPRGSYRAATLGTLVDAFGTGAGRGYCTVGVLGGAQCDKYGNLNSMCIGEYWCKGISNGEESKMKKRLTGCGGASDIAAYADKTIITMEHERRRFPEKVDYIASVAGMRGEIGENRFDCGLYRGGETAVITDLCIMRNDPETGILYVTDIYEGVDPQEIVNNTGWDIDLSRAKPLPAPTYEELRILRMEVDPKRVFLNRKKKH